MRTKQLKFLFMLVAISLIFSPCVKAEDTSADSGVASEADTQESAEAPVVADEEPMVQTLGAAEMTAMTSGTELPPAVSPSAIGGAFSSLISESFKIDLATGAATLSIPIVVPPGRKNVQPNIALSYSSNNSNGICGVGWSIPVSAIQRSTKKGVPRYEKMEGFVAGGEELVNIGENEYRAKIESSFTKYVAYLSADEKWIVKWIAYDKSGTQYHFGSNPSSRMAHPDNPNYIFAWYLDKVIDVYGNAMAYTYDKDDNSVYLKSIEYTSNPKCTAPLAADKSVEFVYTTGRDDKIYNRRPGWPTVIKKRLAQIKVSIDSSIVWTYNLTYEPSPNTSRSLLTKIQIADSEGKTLPAKTFTYQTLE